MEKLDYETNPVKNNDDWYHILRSGSYINEIQAIRSGHFGGENYDTNEENISFRPIIKGE